MKDKIEQYIQHNRDNWDDEMPSKNIWQNIDTQVRHKVEKKEWWKMAVKIAAVSLIIFSVGIGVGINLSNIKGSSNSEMASKLELLESQESSMEHRVGVVLNEIKDQKTKADVTQELKNLDEVYQELRDEMKAADNANMDLIINAMIKNHETKLEILDYILQKQKRTSHDKISI